jgi:hypothetical protein
LLDVYTKQRELTGEVIPVENHRHLENVYHEHWCECCQMLGKAYYEQRILTSLAGLEDKT